MVKDGRVTHGTSLQRRLNGGVLIGADLKP
jgi:hypothetical protein